jgi:hypothetical protein
LIGKNVANTNPAIPTALCAAWVLSAEAPVERSLRHLLSNTALLNLKNLPFITISLPYQTFDGVSTTGTMKDRC